MHLWSLRDTYWQEADCCDGGMGQTLVLETDDGGGGPFLVLKTDRWAMDSEGVDRLASRMKEALARATAEWERGEEEAKCKKSS